MHATLLAEGGQAFVPTQPGRAVSDLEQHRARAAVSLEAAMVARRYYIDDKQKNEIADEFGISRFKVARLLEEARASGIVRIYVDMPSEIDLPLGERVAARFAIRRVIVVRTSDDDSDSNASVRISGRSTSHQSGVGK